MLSMHHLIMSRGSDITVPSAMAPDHAQPRSLPQKCRQPTVVRLTARKTAGSSAFTGPARSTDIHLPGLLMSGLPGPVPASRAQFPGPDPACRAQFPCPDPASRAQFRPVQTQPAGPSSPAQTQPSGPSSTAQTKPPGPSSTAQTQPPGPSSTAQTQPAGPSSKAQTRSWRENQPCPVNGSPRDIRAGTMLHPEGRLQAASLFCHIPVNLLSATCHQNVTRCILTPTWLPTPRSWITILLSGIIAGKLCRVMQAQGSQGTNTKRVSDPAVLRFSTTLNLVPSLTAKVRPKTNVNSPPTSRPVTSSPSADPRVSITPSEHGDGGPLTPFGGGMIMTRHSTPSAGRHLHKDTGKASPDGVTPSGYRGVVTLCPEESVRRREESSADSLTFASHTTLHWAGVVGLHTSCQYDVTLARVTVMVTE